MRSHLLLGLLGVSAVFGTFLTTSGDDPAATPSPAAPSNPADYGHLILQLEGDVQALNITWVTPKTSGYNPTRVDSEFAIDIFDGRGTRLGSYPIDLSRFDKNPARVGQPMVVEGCEVRDTRIATLVNVPFFATATRMQLRRGKLVIGELAAAELAGLLAKGEGR